MAGSLNFIDKFQLTGKRVLTHLESGSIHVYITQSLNDPYNLVFEDVESKQTFSFELDRVNDSLHLINPAAHVFQYNNVNGGYYTYLLACGNK